MRFYRKSSSICTKLNFLSNEPLVNIVINHRLTKKRFNKKLHRHWLTAGICGRFSTNMRMKKKKNVEKIKRREIHFHEARGKEPNTATISNSERMFWSTVLCVDQWPVPFLPPASVDLMISGTGRALGVHKDRACVTLQYQRMREGFRLAVNQRRRRIAAGKKRRFGFQSDFGISYSAIKHIAAPRGVRITYST